jgi:hypothetical protein
MATAYLRAAHAYMLISMPTGTSTIFGVFQAILAFLLKPDELRPGDKLMPFKKFASEIFYLRFYAALQQNSQFCAARRQTKAGSTGSESSAMSDAGFVTKSSREFRIKNL